MTKPFSVLFKSALAILFACSAIPAFAQHGGGGHGGGGGGFHGGGGGGFHGGGGGGFHGGGGGGFRSSGGGGSPRRVVCAACCWVSRAKCAPAPHAQVAEVRGAARKQLCFSTRRQFRGRQSAVWKFPLGAPCRRRRAMAFLWRPSRRPRTFGRTIGKPGPLETREDSTSLAGIAERDLPARCEAFRARAAKSGRMLPRREMLFPGLNRFPPFTIRSAALTCCEFRVPVELDALRLFALRRRLRLRWEIEDFRAA